MAEPEENLDDVISDLVDDDQDEASEQEAASPLEEMQAPDDIEFSGPPVQLTERAADGTSR